MEEATMTNNRNTVWTPDKGWHDVSDEEQAALQREIVERVTARPYYVEGWTGFDCVGFAYRRIAASIVKQANHLSLDKGAEHVMIYRNDVLAAVYYNGGWHHITDERIALEIGED
jgi:hypothetical protein